MTLETTIFGIKMMVKSGLEFFILKSYVPGPRTWMVPNLFFIFFQEQPNLHQILHECNSDNPTWTRSFCCTNIFQCQDLWKNQNNKTEIFKKQQQYQSGKGPSILRRRQIFTIFDPFTVNFLRQKSSKSFWFFFHWGIWF